MSACISSRGEFGSHNIPVDESFCEDCGYLDEDAVIAERDALRAKVARVKALCDDGDAAVELRGPGLLTPVRTLVRDLRAALDGA